MKKITLLASLLLAGSAFANTPVYEQPEQQTIVQYRFGVYNIVNGVATQQPTNQISRSNPAHHLCWAVIAPVPMFSQNINAKETITSPVGANFLDGKSIVQASIDGTHHVVSSVVTPIGGAAFERCWRFDTTDPLGNYTMSVEFGNETMPMRTFTVVE